MGMHDDYRPIHRVVSCGSANECDILPTSEIKRRRHDDELVYLQDELIRPQEHC